MCLIVQILIHAFVVAFGKLKHCLAYELQKKKQKEESPSINNNTSRTHTIAHEDLL